MATVTYDSEAHSHGHWTTPNLTHNHTIGDFPNRLLIAAVGYSSELRFHVDDWDAFTGKATVTPDLMRSS